MEASSAGKWNGPRHHWARGIRWQEVPGWGPKGLVGSEEVPNQLRSYYLCCRGFGVSDQVSWHFFPVDVQF
jgi:hypothetical protein